MEAVCRQVAAEVRMYQESIRSQEELLDTTGVELVQGRSSGKARPMLVIKQEKLDRAANYARVSWAQRAAAAAVQHTVLLLHFYITAPVAREAEACRFCLGKSQLSSMAHMHACSTAWVMYFLQYSACSRMHQGVLYHWHA